MEKNDLFVKKEAGVATLFINRPEKKNAFHYDMWRAFPRLLHEIENDTEVQALVIRGVDDSVFIAGADVGEFQTVRATEEGEAEYNRAVEEAEAALMKFSKPSIAAIQRHCIGGGCIIALAADMRFSAHNGLFGITPAKLGIIYMYSSTKNLADIVGPSRAKDLLFSGRIVGAQEAYQIGLVDHLYADEEIIEKTYEYAKMLTKRSQRTVKGAKQAIDEWSRGYREPSGALKQMIDSSYSSEDYKEGVRAFLEKRSPNFTEN
ncbi:Enoyl-CoA hydratase/carnithine racemase [Alteribacillus persepolensis]|uniref:Enoyl-CoA hydratase/carnithine racemase n=1 Tax=Alteribacillus persepolensis TaxID=568899 RepID=A0A1G8AW98_9BACI|nr:enoyl-CoA hydratase-related protein [Alteribacillus persepolensis]SDH25218.1 Enoyl-CoA hydratase/carnithine racemase [Alteribacillus persepolensis]